MSQLILWLVLLACTDKEDELDDLDGDGFSSSEDCNDRDADSFPGAIEVCDGADNDCDGETDEDVQATFYMDADGDGWGDEDNTREACEAPTAAHVLRSGDCDDDNALAFPGSTQEESCSDPTDYDCDGEVEYEDADGDGWAACEDCDDADAAVNPDATEICDEVDNDCDDLVDDEDTSLDSSTGTEWYVDADGDGFGDPDDSAWTCELPEGYVADATDCDDTEALSNPDETEVCDAIDNDCDGSTDEDDAADALIWFADIDGDGYGDASSTTPACEQPTGYVSDDTDCDDGEALVNPGEDEVCDEIDNDCDGTTDEGDATDASTWYADGDGDGYGDASSSVDACEQPSGYVADDTDCDDGEATTYLGADETCSDSVDNDCDGDVDEECPIEHCGTISSDETWSASDEHIVTCDLYVQGSSKPELTIEDGVIVEIDSGVGIYVGYTNYGSLVIEGTSTGVTLTSSSSSPAAGDWDYLRFGQYDEGSSLTGMTLEYSGGGEGGGLVVYYSDGVVITDSLIQHNEDRGILAYDTTLEVSGTTISDNEDSGIYLYDSVLETSGGPTFTDNNITGNGEYPIILDAEVVEQLDASSTFTGNGTDLIYVLGGTIDEDATWQALDADYLLVDDLSVDGSSDPELTLEDGVTIEIDTGVGITVGQNTGGALFVEGTSTGVTLTSAQSSPAAGDWDGLEIRYYDTGSELTGLTLEYGGANAYGGLYLYYGDVTLVDSTIQQNANDGIYVYGGTIAVSGSTIQDNDDAGVYLNSTGKLETSGGPTFTDNIVTGNGTHPLYLPANYLGQLDASSTYAGNGDDFIYSPSDFVDTTATWQALDVDYAFEGDVIVQDSSNPVVTIEDGVTIEMASGVEFYVGYSGYGELIVEGTSTGVTFTSEDSSPAAGDWDGIYFGSYDTGSELTGLTVEYAGGNGYGGIYARYADVVLTDCTIQDNDNYGVNAYYGTLEISGCTIQDNDSSGVYVSLGSELESSGGPTFTDNTLTGNGDYPIELPANSVGQLDASSTFTGNGDDSIYVHANSTVTDDATWQALDADYFLAGALHIYDSSSPHLDIEAGATLLHSSSAAIYAGVSGYGTLSASGTSGSPVTFTSSQSSPAAGDWPGLYLGSYCDNAASVFDYAVVEYGGSNGYGNFLLGGCSPTISNSTISNSSKYGIYSTGGSAPSLSNISYSNNSSGNTYP